MLSAYCVCLLKAGAWLTNFSITVVLSAAVPKLMIGNAVTHAMLEHVPTDTRVLSTTLYDMLTFNEPEVVASSASTPWGRAPIPQVLRTTAHVLCPLCLDNNHWVAMHACKEFNKVELFVFLQTAHEHESAILHAKIIVRYLIAVGQLSTGVTFCVRASKEWHQTDGSSCGLFTLGVLLSLAQGRRISLDCSASSNRSQDWRRYFTQLVTLHCLGGGIARLNMSEATSEAIDLTEEAADTVIDLD